MSDSTKDFKEKMTNTKNLTKSETNPYEKYRHVPFSLDEFLGMVKANNRHFINYCEIVITENGLIFLASPSHESTVKWLKKKGFNNCISVWYNHWSFESSAKVRQKLTASQLRIINSLIDHGLMLDLQYPGFYYR